MKAQQGVGSGPSPLELDHLAVMEEHRNQDPLGMETRTRKQRLVKKRSVPSPGNRPEASWVFLPRAWCWASLLLRLELEAVSAHLPSTSTRIKPCAAAAADFQHLLKGVQGRGQKWGILGAGITLRDGMGRELGGGFGMGTHVHPWLIMSICGKTHSNIVISLQLK